MMLGGRLDDITREDLERLVSDRRSEGRAIEYKRELLIARDHDRHELVKDIASFANAGGGDLIFGVEEEKDDDGKNTGVPVAVPGIPCPNFDATKLLIENLVRDNIEPRIQGMALRLVEGFERGPVLIIRLQRSWNGPHMVTYNKTHFWSRNSAGRHPLDVHEIRSAFLHGSEMESRVRRFRDERIGRLIAGETPVPLDETADEARLVVHVVPLTTTALVIDLHLLEREAGLLRPPSVGGWSPNYNLDGIVAHDSRAGGCTSYIQAFRDGAVETVTCGFTGRSRRDGNRELYALQIESTTIRAVEIAFALLKAHQYDGAACVLVSVVGVKGAQIHDDPRRGGLRPWARDCRIDRDALVLPDVVTESLARDPRELLRTTFDTLWQASGYPRSPSYNEEGALDENRLG